MSVGPVGPATWAPVGGAAEAPQAKPGGAGPFTRAIEGFLKQANAQNAQADRAIQDLAAGRTDNLHGVMLQLAKADLSFRMVLEVRNRLTDAYQEIMRMQV